MPTPKSAAKQLVLLMPGHSCFTLSREQLELHMPAS
jgi:hypothetical protein